MDDRDLEILIDRQAKLSAIKEIKQGDYVRFADGIERRVSHVWYDGGIQTSAGGSWYLGEGYMSFSGSLFPIVPAETMRRTEEKKPGSAWFFHHDYAVRDGGIPVMVNCAVWECSEPAPL